MGGFCGGNIRVKDLFPNFSYTELPVNRRDDTGTIHFIEHLNILYSV